MVTTTFTLINKNQLTHDVYELFYNCPDLTDFQPKSGQYMMFQLAPWLSRAYSFAYYSGSKFTLIVKRIPDGKVSPIICDAEIGTVYSGMLWIGHFILRDTLVSKCFIGTWTWFAPLYCQMFNCINSWLTHTDLAFIFGVREFQDIFYYDKVLKLWSIIPHHFTYKTYLSREDLDWFQRGYVTDWITPDNIAKYQEFYLCGSPAMVKSAREKLEALGIGAERIFWEQY